MREKINQWREFGLSSLAVNNRKTVYLIITIFLLGGISAYKNMPRESFPQIQVPEIYVNVPYPGNSPEIIADKIIKPFEKELNKLKGIEKITSTATQDFGILKIEFDFGITPKDAKRAVEEALSDARKREAAFDASLQEASTNETQAQLEIARLMSVLEVEGESLAKESESLKRSQLQLEACDRRAENLSAVLVETKNSLELMQRKEEAAQGRITELIKVNKQLKSDFEVQRTSSQRELSQAKALINKMRDERDAAVQRELQIQMQRHAGASRESHVQSAREEVESEETKAQVPPPEQSAAHRPSVKKSPVFLCVVYIQL